MLKPIERSALIEVIEKVIAQIREEYRGGYGVQRLGVHRSGSRAGADAGAGVLPGQEDCPDDSAAVLLSVRTRVGTGAGSRPAGPGVRASSLLGVRGEETAAAAGADGSGLPGRCGCRWNASKTFAQH